MKKFESTIKVGTKVKVNGEWTVVIEMHETRNWIKTEKWIGSFQRGHVQQYSNK